MQEAFRQFKAGGFTAVVNNCLDGEDPHQLGSAAEKCAAEDAGLGYCFIPVASPQITEADVRTFQKAVADELDAQPCGPARRGRRLRSTPAALLAGINGKKLALSSFDTGGKPDQAAAGVTRFAQDEPVLAIVGPFSTSECLCVEMRSIELNQNFPAQSSAGSSFSLV